MCRFSHVGLVVGAVLCLCSFASLYNQLEVIPMKRVVPTALLACVAVAALSASANARCTLSIPFASGSAEVSAASAAYLQRLAAAYPTAQMSVSGHADAVGDPAANAALSERRVDAVLDALRGNGASPDVTARTAKGESDLAVQTSASNVANRRVDLDVPDCDPAIFDGLSQGAVRPIQTTQPTLSGNTGAVPTPNRGLGLLGIGALLAIIGADDNT